MESLTQSGSSRSHEMSTLSPRSLARGVTVSRGLLLLPSDWEVKRKQGGMEGEVSFSSCLSSP